MSNQQATALKNPVAEPQPPLIRRRCSSPTGWATSSCAIAW